MTLEEVIQKLWAGCGPAMVDATEAARLIRLAYEAGDKGGYQRGYEAGKRDGRPYKECCEEAARGYTCGCDR